MLFPGTTFKYVWIGAAKFAAEHRDLACLAFTHLQPAQPTTVGKRACLWAYDLVLDLAEIEHRLATLKARGAKGTTGTQASFLQLFDGDHGKVRRLERLISQKLGFEECYAVTGQTYPRKIDSQVLGVLSGIAQSAHKMATDLRLLAHRKELEEPFEKEQVGSSAMAYKRNPMRSERICSLGRFVMSLESNTAATLSTQWLERTLDDSANRRLVLPQAFLATDAVLILYQNVAEGLVVYPNVIARSLEAELPFMATENILMAAAQKGGSRQELHEKLRTISQTLAVKKEPLKHLLQEIENDPDFPLSAKEIMPLLSPRSLIGRAPEQVRSFLQKEMDPFLARFKRAKPLLPPILV